MKRWTPQKKAALIVKMMKERANEKETATLYGLRVSELEVWKRQFLQGAQNALADEATDSSLLNANGPEAGEETPISQPSQESRGIVEIVDARTGRFLDVSEHGCTSIGYSKEELLAMSVMDVDPSWMPRRLRRPCKSCEESDLCLGKASTCEKMGRPCRLRET